MQGKSVVASEALSENIDPAIVSQLLGQLLPVLCDVYQVRVFLFILWVAFLILHELTIVFFFS